ncbi:HNH endonuclease [Nocardiopsis sp. HNM0947]|uniref:HNH endonuclease n=1 Tax=Nocardiopsis coralli TaxID=2772213 RepID=A0ABR9P8J6_9ACTN|nr:HNH endonuclease family protein [Nocardiopsis coralli]MBE3000168.1 HNH endonuclease [Nocardiopsis coralli]
MKQTPRTPHPSRPSRTPRAVAALATAGAAALVATLGWTSPAAADHTLPPNIPSDSVAQEQLDGLDVQPKGPQDGYDRSLFPHWNVVESPCTARQVVLERDGHDVVTDDSCQPTEGSWWSAFDDEWVYDEPSDISVDHLVPLSEAWKTGAADWTTDERADFANDVESSQLWLATQASNGEKGDQDPSEWMPSNTDVHCDYAKSWIDVKDRYDLTITDDEQSSLQGTLDSSC